MARRLVLPLLLGLLLAAPATAQRAIGAEPSPARLAVGPSARAETPGSAAAAVAASMLLPGAGQWLQGERRWVPYLALEVWSWLRFAERRRDHRQLTDRYQDLAWLWARRVSGVSVGERRDTVFEYYEAMAQYRSSGAWDAAPLQEGLQPEPDTASFNGQLWRLARGLFFPGGQEYAPGTPEYEAALSYYSARAIPDQYRWAWTGGSLEQGVFAGLISDSDDAYRDGTRMLGLILANHVASAVDALITGRLRALGTDRAEFRSELAPQPDGAFLRTQVRITF